MVPILKPPDLSAADKLAGWTSGDWSVSRGSLEFWRCQLNRRLTKAEGMRVSEAHDAAVEDHGEFLLPDFWKIIGTFNPPVLVIRWRADPEHKLTRQKILAREFKHLQD